MARSDLTGRRFGKLVVVRFVPGDGTKRATWQCLCDCGQKAYPTAHNLRTGHSSSCGCYGKNVNTRHKLSKHPIYLVWRNMRARCNNPKNKRFDRYGGRGVRVCERWEVFDNFLVDVGMPPPGCTLERNDNNGHYEPSNCRWASRLEQSRNREANNYYEFNGERLCESEWALRLGISANALRERLERWPLERALTEKPSHKHQAAGKKVVGKRKGVPTTVHVQS